MTTTLDSRTFEKLKPALALALLAAAGLHAEPPDTALRLLLAPSFYHYNPSWPVAGAARTVLVPVRLVEGQPEPLTASELITLGATRESITAEAVAAASRLLASIKPQYVRDKNKVIEYALMESESPLTASIVLVPEFADLFRETLGPEVLVVIPTRFRIYVFPKASPAYNALTDIVFADFGGSPYPISKEIFLVKKGKLSAIGEFR